MASRLYPNYKIDTEGGIATCDAECYSDHQGKSVFAVYGHTEQDQILIALNRVDTTEQLRGDFQRDTGRQVKEISLWVDRGSDRLEGTRIEYGADGEVSRATADYSDSMDYRAVSELGKYLDGQDWANQQDLAKHSFNPANNPNVPR